MNVVYCTNGHYISLVNTRASNWQDVLRLAAENEREDAPHRAKYCATCGAKKISACEHCGELLKPLSSIGGRPSYCTGCSKPLPWTEVALASAKEYTDELAELSTEDKNALKSSFDDLSTDTARTPLAATRFKRIIAKVGPAAADALSKIAVDFATAAAKHMLGW
jgi:hypothetical protein